MNKFRFVFSVCVGIFIFTINPHSAEARQQNVTCQPWGNSSVSYYNNELYISDGDVYTRDGEPWFYLTPVYPQPDGTTNPVLGPVKKVYFNNVTLHFSDLSKLFKGHSEITEVNLSGVKINSNQAVNMDEMFMNCPSLERVTLSNDVAKKTSSANSMFKNNTSLTTINMDAFDSNKLLYTREMFSGAKKLKTVADFDYSNIKDGSYMFKDTKSMEHLNVATVSFVDKKNNFIGFLQGSEIKSFSISSKNPQIRGMTLPLGSWYTADLANPLGLETGYGKYQTTEELIKKADSELTLSGLKESKKYATYYRGITYSIAYNENAGSNKKVVTDKIYTEEEYTITSPSEINNQGKIVSWNTEKDGTGISYTDGQQIKNLTDVDGSIIDLYAQYDSEPYTIKYEANATGVSGSMENQLVEVDEEFVIKNSSYNRDGYNFSYWTTTKEDIEENRLYKGETVSNLVDSGETITLYAQWTPIQYEIIYNDEDETSWLYGVAQDNFGIKDGGSSYSQNMVYDVEENLLPIRFTKQGYSNRYWKNIYQNEIFENNSLVKNLAKNEGDLVLMYTEWRPHKYTVQFDSNGGTGYMSSLDCEYDQSVNLPKETFSRKNYIFEGWAMQATSNNPDFYSQEEIKNLTDKDLAQITLYAVWKKDRLTDDSIQ